MPSFRVVRVVQAGGRGAEGAWQAVRRQPNWVAQIVGAVFLVVVALPFLLLFLLAIAFATLLFMVLAGVNALLGLFTGGGRGMTRGAGAGPDAAGRSNVRVIRRD